MQEPLGVQIVGKVKKVELLSDHANHPGQRGADGIRTRDSSLLIKLIHQSATHPMCLALYPRNAVAHREQERTIGQIAREQPETLVAQIKHDTTFRELRRELVARHDGDRTPM